MAWEQLISIKAEALAYMREERVEPPVACPFDGEPLDTSPHGGLFCPLGNYEYPRMPRII